MKYKDVQFPTQPVSVHKGEMGWQAVFEVPGATVVLGSYLTACRAEMGLDPSKFEFIVSSKRPDQVMVVCDADIERSHFKQVCSRIAAWGQLIEGETLALYEKDREASLKESFAWSSRVTPYHTAEA